MLHFLIKLIFASQEMFRPVFLQHGSDYTVVANWQCRDREAQGRLWSVVYGNYEIRIRIFKM